MTEDPAVIGTSPTQHERLSLVASIVISSVGIVASIVGWWLVRAHNEGAVETGGRIRDLATGWRWWPGCSPATVSSGIAASMRTVN